MFFQQLECGVCLLFWRVIGKAGGVPDILGEAEKRGFGGMGVDFVFHAIGVGGSREKEWDPPE